jgi:hypothetical protein
MRNNNVENIIKNLLKMDVLSLNSNFVDNVKLVNPDSYIISIKQLLKLLTLFLLKNKKGGINVVIQNATHKIFLDKCLIKLNVFSFINVYHNIEDFKILKRNSLVILIGNKQEFRSMVNSLLKNHITLIYFFDSKITNKNFGNFFCLSQIDNIKNLLFIIAIISKTVLKLKQKK